MRATYLKLCIFARATYLTLVFGFGCVCMYAYVWLLQIVAKEELPLLFLAFIPKVFGVGGSESASLFDHRVMLNVVAGRIDANRLGELAAVLCLAF